MGCRLHEFPCKDRPLSQRPFWSIPPEHALCIRWRVRARHAQWGQQASSTQTSLRKRHLFNDPKLTSRKHISSSLVELPVTYGKICAPSTKSSRFMASVKRRCLRGMPMESTWSMYVYKEPEPEKNDIFSKSRY